MQYKLKDKIKDFAKSFRKPKNNKGMSFIYELFLLKYPEENDKKGDIAVLLAEAVRFL